MMITIDGSQGEGRGQILRTALSLSVATGQPFAIRNIRARRSKPGLMRQHLTAVKAAAEISDARVEGAEVGAASLVFEPGPAKSGDYIFRIGSAGSTSLALQTVLTPLALAGRESPSRAARIIRERHLSSFLTAPFCLSSGASATRPQRC